MRGEPHVYCVAEHDGLALAGASASPGAARLLGNPTAFFEYGSGESKHPVDAHLVRVGEVLGRGPSPYPHLDFAGTDRGRCVGWCVLQARQVRADGVAHRPVGVQDVLLVSVDRLQADVITVLAGTDEAQLTQ